MCGSKSFCIHSFLLLLLINLFLAKLVPHCCLRASSHGKQGLLSSYGVRASLVVEHKL